MTTGFDYIIDSLFPSRKRASQLHMIPVDADVWDMLKELAPDQKVNPEELGKQLLRKTVTEHYHANSKYVQKWEQLSERQKDVAALACLKYSNAEIALKLNVSITTVKGHFSEVLRKFEVRGRYQLRYVLRRWDFSSFEKDKPST